MCTEPSPREFRGVGDSTIKGGVVTHRENIIEREFQTEAQKLSSKKASSRPNNSC